MSNKTKTILKSILIFTLFAIAVNAGASWVLPSGPNTPAPAMNIFPPVNVGDVLQFKNGNFVAQGLKSTVSAIFEGSLQITAGTGIPALGKVLTSDATGMASWQTPTGGGSGGGDVTAPPGTGGTLNYVTKWTGPTAIGNSQIYDNGTRVGIATATPDTNSKLDVVGKIKMTGFQLGSAATAGHVLTADVDGNGTWQISGGGGGSGGGWTRDASTSTVRLSNPTTDFVGIGTTTPTQQLEITKNMKIPPTTGQGAAGVIFVGSDRFLHTAGTSNVFLGKNAGSLTTGGDQNTGVGNEALSQLSGGRWNTAIGSGALRDNTDGDANTAAGVDALKNNTTGSGNVAFGYKALRLGGSSGVAVGNNALTNSTGVNNTAVGFNALDSVTTGANNTALGYNADVCATCGNSTAIGANAYAGTSDTMVFGDDDVIGWGFGTQPNGNAIKVGHNSTNGNGATLSTSGEWYSPSDKNKKHNIQDIAYGLEEIIKLRPVSFDWNGTNTHDIGFIAQEVKEIIPEIVYGEEGSMTMSYGHMTAVLTKAVQDLKNENDELRARLEALKLKIKDN